MIKKMLETDIDAVVAIDQQCFPVAWNHDQYHYELSENAFASLYILEVDNTIIGYIDFWITFDTCQLAKIAILPKYRGKHYAHLLMDQMIDDANVQQCENISLEVRVSNASAHALYESYGFIKANVRKQYYQDNGEDADLLIKPLGGF